MSSKNGASRISRARPLMRSVSGRPGTRNSSPTWGLLRMLRNPSNRWFPARSGIASVPLSSGRAKPGGSPLGETSQRPSAAAVAMRQNGDAASHSRSRSCSTGRTLVAERRFGPPNISRSSASEVTSTSSDVLGIGASSGWQGRGSFSLSCRPGRLLSPGGEVADSGVGVGVVLGRGRRAAQPVEVRGRRGHRGPHRLVRHVDGARAGAGRRLTRASRTVRAG